ncbi:hypothetical protein JCM33374_g168 [Metschnikowia sp. JCM 33374]|nr:hypothetical protein JCM33374_g168 [Metschnikowia sp. JCM 33374]
MKIESLNPSFFLDIEISGQKIGRIVLELFEHQAPSACGNFCKLGARLEGTYFHRIIKNFMIQGGDIIYAQANKYNANQVGAGLHPDGITFDDENLDQAIDRPFLLCMANSGINSNGSQFFITTASAPHLNGKHTVFGQVKHGKSVIREIERVSTTPENVPLEDNLPVIVKFGEWFEGDAIPVWNACYDQIAGDIYEEYPDDDEHIQKDSSKSVFEASSIIKESGVALLRNGEFKNASFKFKKCLRYVMEYIPDEDQEPEYFRKFVELKKKLYLNLSLSCLKLKDYIKCVDYCTFLLDMDITEQERAKTLFRLGQAMISGKKFKEAVTILEQARDAMQDPAIEKELARAEGLLQKQKDAEKSKYAKFFS